MTPPRPRAILTSFVGYRRGWVLPDVIAGLTLAAIAVPEQMATARLAGVAPQIGFFAFLAGTLGFAVFGASRPLSSGADSTIAPIFAGVLATLAAAGSPHYAALAAGLALLVGALVLIAGLSRMGWIGDLLSIPVMTGFLVGIAVHIMASQLPASLGLPDPGGEVGSRLLALIRAAPHANPYSAAITVGVLSVIAVLERLFRRAPGALLALVLASVAVSVFHLERHGVVRLGAVSGGLPHFLAPMLSRSDWTALAPLAALIALVVMVQTAAVSRAFPAQAGDSDVAGDFRGVGVGSLLAGLIGAFPVDASPPRTAMVLESGARSQFAGLTAAGCIVLVLVFGTHLLRLIPTAALSGILIFVALRLVRVKDIVAIVRRSRQEIVLTAATAAGIILLPMEWGVGLGIALSILHGVWTGARVHVQPMSRLPGSTVWWPDAAPGVSRGETLAGVVVLAFPAPLTFLDAASFTQEFLNHAKPGSGSVNLAVLEAAGLTLIDFTAARALQEMIGTCRKGGVDFAIARLESVVAQNAFSRLGLTKVIGADHMFDSVAEALAALAPAQATHTARD